MLPPTRSKTGHHLQLLPCATANLGHTTMSLCVSHWACFCFSAESLLARARHTNRSFTQLSRYVLSVRVHHVWVGGGSIYVWVRAPVYLCVHVCLCACACLSVYLFPCVCLVLCLSLRVCLSVRLFVNQKTTHLSLDWSATLVYASVQATKAAGEDTTCRHLLLFISALIPKALASLLTSVVRPFRERRCGGLLLSRVQSYRTHACTRVPHTIPI